MKDFFQKVYGKSSFVVNVPFVVLIILVGLILLGNIWPGSIGADPERVSAISKWLFWIEKVVLGLFLFWPLKWIYKKVRKK